MNTKPKLNDLAPEDRARYVQAVDSAILSLLTIADVELKRYPDLAATAAMSVVHRGLGVLGFNVTFCGDQIAIVAGLMRPDGTMETELAAMTLNAKAPEAGGKAVH